VNCCGFNSLLFAPIAAHRLIRRLIDTMRPRRDYPLQSDFNRSRFPLLQAMLERVFRAECRWLDRGYGPPWGVSALLVATRR
jgi:hypothetical protein